MALNEHLVKEAALDTWKQVEQKTAAIEEARERERGDAKELRERVQVPYSFV